MRVLIAEDNAVNAALLGGLLRRWGFETETARDGTEAWELVQKRPYNVLLSDWMMPGVDGLELCRRVRASGKSSYTHVILITSRGAQADLIAGLDAGADDFLVKPVDPAELRVRLNAAKRVVELERKLDERNAMLSRANKELAAVNRSLAREMQAAAVLQQRLLPPRGGAAGVRIEWLFSPASAVAGDTFGYFALDKKRVGFYLIDVCGHGVSSAMLSFALSRAMRPQDQADAADPARLVASLNERFPNEETGLYFTMVYGVIDAASRVCRFVQAGHPAPLFLSDGEVREVGDGGMPVGLLTEARFECHEVAMKPGERMVLYSDGIPECASPEDERFGAERLFGALAANSRRGLGTAVSAVDAELRAWRQERDPEDDLSLLALEVPA